MSFRNHLQPICKPGFAGADRFHPDGVEKRWASICFHPTPGQARHLPLYELWVGNISPGWAGLGSDARLSLPTEPAVDEIKTALAAHWERSGHGKAAQGHSPDLTQEKQGQAQGEALNFRAVASATPASRRKFSCLMGVCGPEDGLAEEGQAECRSVPMRIRVGVGLLSHEVENVAFQVICHTGAIKPEFVIARRQILRR